MDGKEGEKERGRDFWGKERNERKKVNCSELKWVRRESGTRI